jgi:hypothetical protein
MAKRPLGDRRRYWEFFDRGIGQLEYEMSSPNVTLVGAFHVGW